jgi:hypothetical protein
MDASRVESDVVVVVVHPDGSVGVGAAPPPPRPRRMGGLCRSVALRYACLWAIDGSMHLVGAAILRNRQQECWWWKSPVFGPARVVFLFALLSITAYLRNSWYLSSFPNNKSSSQPAPLFAPDKVYVERLWPFPCPPRA